VAPAREWRRRAAAAEISVDGEGREEGRCCGGVRHVGWAKRRAAAAASNDSSGEAVAPAREGRRRAAYRKTAREEVRRVAAAEPSVRKGRGRRQSFWITV
jgi:hypothetical protein